jgi:hypothetical protein
LHIRQTANLNQLYLKYSLTDYTNRSITVLSSNLHIFRVTLDKMESKPKNRWRSDIEFLEQGDIYFFYKPKKEVVLVKGWDDVARFYFVLDPQGQALPRYIVMGNKKMPSFADGDQKTTWGFVQIIGGKGFATTLTQTPARQKTASRPAGEGIYTIVKHGDHVHLLYALELPRKSGRVQKEFNISSQANYIFSTRDVTVSPSSPEQPFSNFSPADLSKLNQKGTEVLLIGIGADITRLGLAADRDQETLQTADIFSSLKVDITRHPIGSLISGEWE